MIAKREIRNSFFQVLESGVVSGKILKSFSVTHQTVVTLLEKTLAQFTLDRNIMVHNVTNIPAKSVKQTFKERECVLTVNYIIII